MTPTLSERLRFIQGDIADAPLVAELARGCDAIVNFAAESHVDRSILDPGAFLRTDVMGVHALLEAARHAGTQGEHGRACRFLQVSTDEVYGPFPTGSAVRETPSTHAARTARPRPPGRCSRSYLQTYGLDVVITRGANTYGPRQHPEKLIPLFVTNALSDQPLPMYGDGMQRRDWLFVSDHARAVLHVLRHGHAGAVYNIPGEGGHENREVVRLLLQHLGAPGACAERRGSTLAPRPPIRDGRRAAGVDRLAGRTRSGSRAASSAPSSGTALEAIGGEWCARAIGMPTTNASTGHDWRAAPWPMADRPIAVTGPSSRLGRAVLAQLEADGHATVGWGRPDYDLDDLAAADRLLGRDRPSVVIHAAAWTDVDGCSREPGAREATQRRGHGRARDGVCGARGAPAPRVHERGVRRTAGRPPGLYAD